MLPAPTSAKHAALRWRLIVRCIKSFALLFALGIALWSVMEYADNREARYNTLSGEVNSLGGAISTLQQKLSQAAALAPLYQALVAKQGGPQVLLDRQHAEDAIKDAQKDLPFNTLKIGIAPVRELKATDYKNAFANGMICDITLAFDALSDEHVMDFLRRLRMMLPGGAVQISELALMRNSEDDLDPKIIAEIAKTGRASLIRAEVKVDWLGMQPPAPATPPAAAPAPAPGAAR